MKRRCVRLPAAMLGCLMLVLLCDRASPAAGTALVDRIAADFAPLSGYVVKAADGKIIVDLDADNGLAMGDVLAVLGEGEKLVHPVTKKVIGTLDRVKTLAKVIRLKQGFSFARLLNGGATVAAGDPVRRYGAIPAVLWDYTGNGRQFAARLEKKLPALKWQPYDTGQAQKPQTPQAPDTPPGGLVFIITARQLQVRDPEFVVLRTYDLSGTDVSVGTVPPPMPLKPREEGREPVRYQPVFEGARTIGALPGVARMGDFLRHQTLLLAVTDGSKIYVFRVDDSLVQLAQADTAFPGQILTVRWWQPEPGTGLYLAVSMWADRMVRGMIFQYENRRIRMLHDNINRTLGTFDRDNDGRPETLLAQSFDPENYYGRNIRQIRLQNGGLAYQRVPFKTPRRFNVIGAHRADLTGDGEDETVFIRNGVLYIYAGKKLLYNTQREFGGSLARLTYDIDPQAKDAKTTTAEFEIAPVSADLDGDGITELLLASSDRSVFTVPSAGIGVGKPALAVIKYRGGRFVRGELGGNIDGWVQGLAVFDKQVLCIVSEPGSLLKGSGSSHLVRYPLAE